MSENQSIHAQEPMFQLQRLHKRQAFDRFIQNYAIYTSIGAFTGLTLSMMTGGSKLRIIGLGAGIGGGVALSMVANDFNKIHCRE